MVLYVACTCGTVSCAGHAWRKATETHGPLLDSPSTSCGCRRWYHYHHISGYRSTSRAPRLVGEGRAVRQDGFRWIEAGGSTVNRGDTRRKSLTTITTFRIAHRPSPIAVSKTSRLHGQPHTCIRRSCTDNDSGRPCSTHRLLRQQDGRRG